MVQQESDIRIKQTEAEQYGHQYVIHVVFCRVAALLLPQQFKSDSRGTYEVPERVPVLSRGTYIDLLTTNLVSFRWKELFVGCGMLCMLFLYYSNEN
jgi:hypothetical protein